MRQRNLLSAALLALALTVLSLVWPFLWNDRPTKALIAHVGELRTICGKVESAYYARGAEGQPTFLNLGGKYPDHVLAVVIWGKHRYRFNQPEVFYRDRRICVTGVVEAYDDKVELVVEAPVLIQTLESPSTLGSVLLGSVFSTIFTVLLQKWLETPPGKEPVPRAQEGREGRLGRRLRSSRWRWILVPVVGGLLTIAVGWVLWR